MENKLTSNSTIYLRDQQHAARVFVDDQFRLAPKLKFLFHVAFSINTSALKNINLAQRHRNEIGLLVKSVALPTFEVTATMVNQYNRKKYIQSVHSPKPVDIKFHDDNMGIINQLWQNYYSYYYADSTSAEKSGAYNRTATRNSNFITAPYGLDNGSTTPFFNYITIYQLARHEYVSYKLINPMIISWKPSGLDYAGGGDCAVDATMNIGYEAVSYGAGRVSDGTVEGFATEHYDLTPSPLIAATGGRSSASPTFANAANVVNNAANNFNTMATQINTYENTKLNPNNTATGVLANLTTTAVQRVSGVQGIAFPVKDSTRTIASLVKLGK